MKDSLAYKTTDKSPWSKIDLAGFGEDLEKLRSKIFSALGEEDFRHLKKIERLGRGFTFLGYATAWIFPNPLTAFCLSLGQFTRWILAHHILHRGYDKVPGIPKRYTSSGFAKGWRRFVDWFDWLSPAAWDYEHNILHHYHTGEAADPDLLEKHLQFLRQARVPRALKYLFIFLASLTWKYTYYAPNTFSVLDPDNKKRLKSEHIVYLTIKNVFDLRNKRVQRLWIEGYLPYGIFNFIIVPLLFFPLGQTAVLYVLLNKLLAECITNVHAFLVIGPNHTADDLYRFYFHYNNKNEFYLTQVLGSANYNCGTESVDYLSSWLNYQIEHHLFPDLPMLKYRQVQPQVKALCQRYGIPYRQENIFRRFGRMLDVCVGKKNLLELSEL